MPNIKPQTSSSPDMNVAPSKILWLWLAVAFGLRLTFLGSKSLWLDEANALRVVSMGQAALWSGKSELFHPPLFYGLLEQWLKVGNSEFVLRLPGAVLGSLTIVLIYLLAKNLLGQAAALSAAAMAAVSPLLVWYSQDMRPYALLCLLGLMVMHASLKLFVRPNPGWWLVFVLGMAASLYLHYFAILLLPLQLVLWVSLLAVKKTNKSVLWWVLLGWGCIILLYWPWLQTPAAARFLHLAINGNNDIFYALADRLNIVVNMAIFTSWYFFGGLLLFSGACLFVLYRVLRLDSTARYIEALRHHNWVYAGILILFLGLLAASVIPRGYTLKRQLVILWPYVLLFFGWFWPWQHTHRKWLIGLLVVSLIGSLINILVIPKPQWREVTAFITENYEDQDLVVLEPNYYVVPYDYYDQSNTNRVGISTFGLTQPKLAAILSPNKRVWVVVHGTDPHAQNHAKKWLDEQAQLIDIVDFFRLQVRLYQISDQ